MRLPALALLLLSVLFTGCRFDNPLTPPSKELNTWLLGVWEYKDAKGKTYRTGVLPLAEDRYTVWFRSLGKKPSEMKEWQFEAWISRVGNSRFLTLQCKKSAGELPVGSFLFVHYQVIDQNHVIIRPLQLDSPTDTTSFKLRSEVRKKLKDNTLLPTIGTAWQRVSEVYWPQEGAPEQQPFQPLRNPIE